MTDRPDMSAVEVSEHLLAVTEAPLLSGDGAAFAERCLLPQVIGTFGGARLVRTKAELIETVTAVSLHYRRLGVTRLERYTIEATFLDPDTVSATCVSHPMRNTEMVQAPITCHGRLRRDAGLWKIAEHHYAIEGAPHLDAALVPRKTSTVQP